jgi:hypothetical protein
MRTRSSVVRKRSRPEETSESEALAESETDTEYYLVQNDYVEVTENNMEDVLRQIMSGASLTAPRIREADMFRLLRRLGRRWMPSTVHNSAEFGEWAHAMFGTDPNDPDLSFDEIQRKYELHLFQMQRLLYFFVDTGVHQKNDPDFTDIGLPMSFISKLHEILTMARDYLFAQHRIFSIWGNHTEMNVPREIEIFRFSGADVENLTEFQSFLIYLLNNLRMKGYRKKGGNCYEQKIVVYNGKRYGTRAWEFKETIREFIYKCVNKSVNYEQWKNMLSSRDNVNHAAQYLMNSSDAEFPFLNISRYLHAYRNGIYYTLENSFIPYPYLDTYGDKFENLDCCKYHDSIFESSLWIKQLPADAWFDIPTPAIEQILIYQGHDEEVRRWVYIMLGRLLYDINEKDNWQCILFIKGPGGTGKSSIGKAVRNFYRHEDVADLSNNIEKKFGLSAIFDKYMYLCLEAKENFNLEQTEFQSMVSGEGVSIAIKRETAISRVWKVPGMLCGNVLPRWMDPGGAISRRVVLLGFENFVIKSDPSLGDRLLEESAAFLCKCNRAYLWGVQRYGNKNIWDALPDYFKEKQDELIETSNQLVHFLNHCAEIEQKEDMFMLEDEFINKLNKYMKDKKLGNFTWMPEYFGHVFAQRGIRLEKSVRRYNGYDVYGSWIVGIGERANSMSKMITGVQLNQLQYQQQHHATVPSIH